MQQKTVSWHDFFVSREVGYFGGNAYKQKEWIFEDFALDRSVKIW
jgi:hypothetical protein